MQDTIGDLWSQTRIASPFGYDILCVHTLVTRKLQVVCGRFTYRTTTLLSEMYIFCVRAGCDIGMAIYASKHASESLSYKPFVRTYTHDLKSTGPIRTFCISNDSSTIQRHSLWWLELHENFHWRDTALGTHRSFLHRTLCVYTESPYIHRYLVRNDAWQQTSRTLWLHDTHQTTALLPTMQSFYKNKVG